MKIILFGWTGLLGKWVADAFASANSSCSDISSVQSAPALLGSGTIFLPTSAQVDFCKPGEISALINKVKPQLVINCAAMTNVDQCESEPEKAWQINAHAVLEMAQACDLIKAKLVHVSTDFVFNGELEPGHAYKATDSSKDIFSNGNGGVYQNSKYCGEVYAAIASNHLILRTAWMYGGNGNYAGKKTFPEWFIDKALAAAREFKAGRPVEKVTLLTNRYGSPTYARDVSTAILLASIADARGTFHAVNSNSTSDASEPVSQAAWAMMCLGAYCELCAEHGMPSSMFEPCEFFEQNSEALFIGEEQSALLERGVWKVRRPINTTLAPSNLGGLLLADDASAIKAFCNRLVAQRMDRQHPPQTQSAA